MRKYKFFWDLIGDVEDGRPNLGTTLDLETYRLMQFTMRDVLEERFGAEIADDVFFNAGKLAGREFFKHYIAPVNGIDEFVSKTQAVLKNKRIGILRLEEAMLDKGRVLLTIDEDLDCSGLPELDYESCIYDEGFISSLFECFTNEKWRAEEIDCWCTGARTCRFLVTQENRSEATAQA
ncbi:MAG: 4-vinyl reductase [Clostridiales Family XIII bacterium]|jgi:predicted hydrocarbon binding protein|nr:4-vinyl reductase [Clostridiales Family XIII bacterium]